MVFFRFLISIEKIREHLISSQYIINQKTQQIRQSGHIQQLYQRPFPAVGFSLYHSNGTHTLHGQYVKYH